MLWLGVYMQIPESAGLGCLVKENWKLFAIIVNYRKRRISVRYWYGAYYCWWKLSVKEWLLLGCSIFRQGGFRLVHRTIKNLYYFKAACVGCCVIEESIYRTRLLITCDHNLINRTDFACTSDSDFRRKLSVLCAGIWCTRLRKVKRNRE